MTGSRLPPLAVAEDLDVPADLGYRPGAGLVASVVHQPVLQRSPKTLHRCIDAPTALWDEQQRRVGIQP